MWLRHPFSTVLATSLVAAAIISSAQTQSDRCSKPNNLPLTQNQTVSNSLQNDANYTHQSVGCQSVGRALVRRKRQALICPTEPAEGSAVGYLWFILYSPQTRSDLAVGYGALFVAQKFIDSGFNTSLPTLFYVHAYTETPRSSYLRQIRKQYNDMFPPDGTQKPTFNLLFFDWAWFAKARYGYSVKWMPKAALALGQYLEDLVVNHNYDPANIHMVTFSLGSHLCGNAARYLHERTGKKLGQLTTDDPTGVCFHTESEFADKYRLRSSDAEFVVAKHYDWGGLGSRQLIGGLDIFVNDGAHQPRQAGNLAKSLIGLPGATLLQFFKGSRSQRQSSVLERRRRSLGSIRQETEIIDRELLDLSFGLNHEQAAEHEGWPEDHKCFEMAYECASYEAFVGGECGSCGPDGSGCYYINNMGRANFMNSSRPFPDKTNYRRGTRMYLLTSVGPFCLYHYQVRVLLRPDRRTGPGVPFGFVGVGDPKQVAQDYVSFLLGASTWWVTPRHHEAGGHALTALLTKHEPLPAWPQRVHLSRTGSTLRLALASIQQLELNYLSHPLSEERERRSARFCPPAAPDGGDALVRC